MEGLCLILFLVMIVNVELVSCPPVESLTPVLGTQGKDLRLGSLSPFYRGNTPHPNAHPTPAIGKLQLCGSYRVLNGESGIPIWSRRAQAIAATIYVRSSLVQSQTYLHWAVSQTHLDICKLQVAGSSDSIYGTGPCPIGSYCCPSTW